MITVLTGGTGGAKLARGLAAIMPPGELKVVVNTGDDWTFYGLQISPDVDMVLYTLAGILDEERGWGIRGDSFRVVERLRHLGENVWFNVGDQDLAFQLKRNAWLGNGGTPTGFAIWLSRLLHINAEVLPMTDAHVETRILTENGDWHFEEYLVKEKAKGAVRKIWFRGMEAARPSDEVLNAIRCSDAIIFGPSNPLVSNGPILSVPGLREEIKFSKAVKVAISPVVGKRAIKGPLVQMMTDLHLDVSALGVAGVYRDLLDVFVLDQEDVELAGQIAAEFGFRVLFENTRMVSPEKEIALACAVVECIRSLKR
jgi:LPPG:FO 2-phospho-L-lactate transferase